MGLYLAAASFAAMFEGEGMRSARGSSGTARVLELLELLKGRMGEVFGLTALFVLPPVQSLRNGEAFPAGVVARGVPVPTLAAARRAPLFPPVYVFTWGFGLTGGLAKAEDAPRSAASRTLYWVSPVFCGTRRLLRALVAELIESP